MSASLITSVITGGTNSHQTVAEELNAYATDFVTQGVIGPITSGSPATGSFAVTQDSSPDMGVTVLSGVAYVTGTPSGQDSQVVRVRMTSNYTSYTINSNSSGSTKYDWIYLMFNATNASTPDTAADNVITLYTSRSSSNSADNGAPPTYGLHIATVTVANGASSITNGNISDARAVTTIGASSNTASTGWQTLGAPLTYSANNGNKEFTVTTSNNLAGLLGAGAKLSVVRSVSPPTQCMAFQSGNSQYATKSSPSGITFTAAFTCEAWVYLLTYTGQTQYIVNRSDAANTTGGWRFIINGSGLLQVDYGTTTNFTTFLSNQSVPLNQWVHVAIAVTSVASKTAVCYINGVSVSFTTPNTNSTTLTQASVDLRLGAASATPTNTYLNGYMSEVRLWSVAQTQANIQANMAINLVGSESNLIGLWQGSGNFNDATSNANNLTATNGAVATQPNNPYNATEYALITNVSYSAPTTTLTLFTGDLGTIPNQTLNTPFYSNARSPFGFPADRNKWQVNFILGAQSPQTSSATYVNVGSISLSIPTGAWTLEAIINYQIGSGYDGYLAIGTNSSGAPANGTIGVRNYYNGTSGTWLNSDALSYHVSPASQTIYYLLVKSGAGTISIRGIADDSSAFTRIKAISTYV